MPVEPPHCIAIIGGAGNTGSRMVAECAQQGLRTRTVSRRAPGRAPPGRSVEWRLADLGSRDSLAEALEGAQAAYYIPPVFSKDEERFGHNVIAAAEMSGCDRFVYHSVLHSATPDMPHHHRKAQVELRLRQSSLRWSVLQPAMYAQTVLAFLSEDRRTLTPGFSLARSFSPVALQDLAQVCATVLTQPGHEFATYELAGPERLNFADLAALLTELIGQPIEARAASPSEVVASVQAKLGFDAQAAELLGLMLEHYDRHGLVGNSKVLSMLLGRPATSVREALKPMLRPRGDERAVQGGAR